MNYHVLAGDALAEEFKKTGIDGEIIVCRECLVVGDVDAEGLPEFWEQRARFILSEYAEDEIVYHETVADELNRLLDMDDDDEVSLWFEYELFCSVNMWFCLWLLNETEAVVYRVAPTKLSAEDRWLGFGKMTADDLKICFAERVQLSRDEIQFGADLWNAYRRADSAKLTELAEAAADVFPYLREVAAAAIEKDTRPIEILRELGADSGSDLADVFPEFVRRAGVYGFGDLQVQSLLDQISS